MPASAATAAERAPRRARYLIARDTPRRGEILAALGVAALAVHVLFAQLTIVLTAALYGVGKISRWRPLWLAAPGGAGLIWVLAIGPAAAVAGLTAGPRQVAAYLGAVPGEPGRLLHLGTAFGGLGHWLPRQLPLALVLAAAEVAVACWLSWLHADERSAAPPRAGLIVAARRKYSAATVRAGGVVTREGGCLGVDRAAGGLAAVSWREAEGGVLAAGAGPGHGQAGPGLPGPGPAGAGYGPAETTFQLVHAAIRRRKPVIAVDLTGNRWLAGSLAAVCDAAGAPFRQFGEAGQACYEPLRGGDPARAASLVLGMIDWSQATGQHRRTCAAYLGDLFAVLAVAPGDPREPVLDDVVRLLSPVALRTRLGRLPGHDPQRGALADRVAASACLAEADPAALPALASQLTALRAAAPGRWLRPGSSRISLGQVLRERAVCLFALDHGLQGGPASMIAGLVAFDAMALFAELRGIGVSGDGVAWLSGCEVLERPALAELVAGGSRTGMAVLLSTMAEAAAASLAADVNVVAIHQLADPAAAGQLATLALAGAGPGLPGYAVPPPGRLVPAGQAAAGMAGGHYPAAGMAGGHYPAAGMAGHDPAPAVPGAVPLAASGAGLAGRAVPAWAQRMPTPASAGSPATGEVAVQQGLAGNHPFQRDGSTAVSAESLLRLPAGAFALLVKGPRRRLLPQCQAVPVRMPGPRA
jgi:hypothetical protein